MKIYDRGTLNSVGFAEELLSLLKSLFQIQQVKPKQNRF